MRQRHVCVVAVVAVLTGTAGAQLSVHAPVNRSVVNSPFYLLAESAFCQSQPTASMAYSIDSGSDVVTTGARLLQTTINAANGSHALHVKAWGNLGSLCERTLWLEVGGGVHVSAPALGARVTSPFVLEAQAPTCGGQRTRGLEYVVDSISDPHDDHGLGDGQRHENGSKALNASVRASTGLYLLRVKAWGDSGAYCETDSNLNVSTTSGLVPPSVASQYAHLENDLTYTGPYASCGGATGPSGDLWQTQPDCGTVGTKTGSTSIVSTPIYGKQPDSREFTMTFDTSGGGVRWFDAKATSETATHFQYDAYVNIVDVSKVMNIEMDLNHAVLTPTSLVYILAAQCNLAEGLFQVTVNQAWVNTNVTCTASQVASGVWHHFQIRAHHDANGSTGIYYDAVAMDGNVTPITKCTNASTGATIVCQSTALSLGWGGVIGPNFQLDGSGTGGTATAFVDDFSVFYW
jgi:hypothetical protein